MKTLISYGAIFDPYDHLLYLGTFSYPDIKFLFSSPNMDFDFNRKDANGNNYLLYASNTKSSFHSDLFKNTKLDFNVQDAEGNTPLHLLIQKCRFNDFKSVVNQYQIIFYPNKKGITAFQSLIQCYCRGYWIEHDLIESCLKAGADITEAQIEVAKTPLGSRIRAFIDAMALKYPAFDVKEPNQS
jgi:ankyrin repeat protein